jgi:hypothetical protein
VCCISVSSSSDAFNVCAVKLSNCKPQTTVLVVYLTPGASGKDAKALYTLLNSILSNNGSYLIVGDFNCPRISPFSWSLPIQPCYSGAEGELVQFILERDLHQLNLEPSRLDNTLDLVLVPPSLHSSKMYQLPPFGGSDHCVQVVTLLLSLTANSTSGASKRIIDYSLLQSLLQAVNWYDAFACARDVDDFVHVFEAHLQSAISCSSRLQRKRRGGAPALPHSIIKLVRRKHAAWRAGKRSGDLSEFRRLRNAVRKAIKELHMTQERALLSKDNKSQFFRYVNSRLGKKQSQPILVSNGVELTTDAAVRHSAQSLLATLPLSILREAVQHQ